MHSPSTFSLILETENLAAADVSGFNKVIESLLKQDLPVSSAQEVIVIDTGDLSDSLKQEVQQEYPWMRFVQASDSLSYYEVKQFAAESATGEIVVYCDTDCVYSPRWLQALVEPFLDPAIEIVCGETKIPVTGIYSMATALNYMLHRQPSKAKLTKTPFYYFNNVAFRRQVLCQIPMPTDLPIYRGTCSVHSRLLMQKGHCIWKQSIAEAWHAPPNGIQHYFWRFLAMGHDHYWLDVYFAELQCQSRARAPKTASQIAAKTTNGEKLAHKTSHKPLMTRINQKVGYIIRQTNIYLQEDPELKRFILPALPIVLLSQSLIFAGRAITSRYPHLLLKEYLKRFEPEYGQKLFAQSYAFPTPAEWTERHLGISDSSISSNYLHQVNRS